MVINQTENQVPVNSPPSVNQPPLEIPIPPLRTKNWLLPIIVLLLILSLGAASFFAYQNYQTKKQSAKSTSISQKIPSPTPTPNCLAENKFLKEITNSPEKSGWKIYKGNYFEISFPSQWSIKTPGTDTGFPEALSLVSPTSTTEILIGAKYDFPFGLTDKDLENIEREEEIKIKIGEEVYSGKEIQESYPESLSGQIYTRIFSTVDATNFQVSYVEKSCSNTNSNLIFYIGNDYPLQSARPYKHSDPEIALSEYQKERVTVDQILSTFKFLD